MSLEGRNPYLGTVDARLFEETTDDVIDVRLLLAGTMIDGNDEGVLFDEVKIYTVRCIT